MTVIAPGDPTPLEVTEGQPWSWELRIHLGTDLGWSSTDEFEVRSQVRGGEGTRYPLRVDLTPYLTTEVDGTDIVVRLSMTGQQTRGLKSGHYDVLLSDPGLVDARAVRPMFGELTVKRVVTSAGD